MKKIKEIIRVIIEHYKLHFSIWVKEPVYKPEIVAVEKPKEKNKEGFVIVDGVKIEDTEHRHYSFVTTPIYSTYGAYTSSTMSSCSTMMTGFSYPIYFKDYLNATSSDSK